jgi:hypothetical protein
VIATVLPRRAGLIVSCAIVCCLFTLPASAQHVASYTPDSPQDFVVNSPEVTVRVTRAPYSRAKLAVGRQGTEPSGIVELAELMQQVDEVRIVSSDRAVVLGSASGSSRFVEIVDLGRAVSVDGFICYGAWPNSEGTRIVLRRYFPRNQPNARFVYALYDLGRSPEDNRSPGVQGADWIVAAGHQFFPIERDGRRRLDSSPDARIPHGLASDVSWLGTSHVVFAERTEDQVNAVLVVLSPNGTPAVSITPMPARELVDSACAESDGVQGPASLIYVESVAATRSGAIVMRLRPHRCMRTTSFTLRVQ